MRWLLEEQRWLREEQRWQREEQRWIRERESLLQEIQVLKLRLQSLESRDPVHEAPESEAISRIGALLQVLKEKNMIAESGTSARELVLEDKPEEVKEVVVDEGVRVLEDKQEEVKEVVVGGGVRLSAETERRKKKVLRKGSEGDDVREMQDALQKLGFYSGEEDMEFSSFSDGTERAVKTWQATIDSPETGIMTAELLERLYVEQQIESEGNSNGAAVASVTKISEVQQTVVQDSSVTEDITHNRVFLLGENRWEEPSRLVGRDKQVNGSKTTIKCLTCRGEGRLMCLECDGTGEPNLEPQFMEWVDEGTKCPYCEGNGYTICDVCHGKPVL